MVNYSGDMAVLKVKNDPKIIDDLCEQILTELKSNGFTKDDIFGSHLALEEAFVNAQRHGNKGDHSKNITIKYKVTQEKLDIYITDEGPGFNPSQVPDPRCDSNIYKPGGRGVLLMRAYMDLVEYNDSGNTVHMIRHKNRKDV